MPDVFIHTIFGAAIMFVGMLVGAHIGCTASMKRSPLKLPELKVPFRKKTMSVPEKKEPDKRFN